ncbi:MAG: S24 family peptidase [Clostridia bacterium]|nr:S24 family peptidase [Clostridia bacterium]
MSDNISRKSIQDMAPVIYEIVSAGGSVKLEVKGVSMMPLLRNERDSVLLKKADNLSLYDVVLFKRANGKIALHRIVEINNDTYTIIGDNQYRFDRNIKQADLIAKAVEFHRGTKRIGENGIRKFGAFWYTTYPIRNFIRRGFSWIKRHLPDCIRSLRNKFR